jgi:bifunctional DNA-binding transcriptional regulator/antitoxin component of YhaV-PrlF toxin-antitoxin module
MTYKLKLSSKNQVTIPVALLRELDIDLTKASDNNLLIVKNLQGKYELVNPFEMLKNLQGSLKSPKHLENLSDEELEEYIEIAKKAHIQNKYGK